MTGRRPDREPFEAIEVGIRRLRLIGLSLVTLALAVPGADRPGRIGLGILLALAGAALVGDRISRRLSRGADEAERLVAAQLGIDLTVTVGILLVLEPDPGSGLWLAVALPVVEGAIRYGLVGACTVWLATTIPVTGWTIANWMPGDGLATMTGTGGVLSIALAVGLPAGRAADRLTSGIQANEWRRSVIEEQAHLVSVLAVAGNELSSTGGEALARLLVEAANELGFPGAELLHVDVANGQQRSLATEPAGFVAAVPAGEELRRVLATPSGETAEGPIGTTLGVLANNGERMTILAVGAEDDGRWEPRHEAFSLLCRSGSAAVATAVRRHEVDEASRRLDHRRTHDPLTGLLNRAGFAATLASTLGGLTPGAEVRLLLIDLDGFGQINATTGWTTGDQVLTEIGARLQRTSPPGTAVGRLEADRFAVVIDDATSGQLADHLRDILARPIATPQGAVVVEASIGQVITGDPEYSPTAALREAELRARVGKALADSGSSRSEGDSL